MSLTGHHAASCQAALGGGVTRVQVTAVSPTNQGAGAERRICRSQFTQTCEQAQEAAESSDSLAPPPRGAASSPAAAVTWGSRLGATSWEPCPLPLRGSLLCQYHRGPLRAPLMVQVGAPRPFKFGCFQWLLGNSRMSDC